MGKTFACFKKLRIKSIINFTVFLLLIISIFGKITWLFKGNNAESRADIAGFRNQDEEIDVLLYGGSTLLRFYQPLEAWDKYGYTSYNYATSSGTVDLSQFFIEDSIQNRKAKLYVCDIRTLIGLGDYVSEPSLRNWADSLPVFSWARWKGITQYLFTRNLDGVDVPSFYFDIIKYHTNYNSLKSEYQWKYMNLDSIYNTDKGFDPNKSHVPFKRPEEMDTVGELTERQRNTLDNLLNYCDKEDLQVLFICCPFIIDDSDWECLNAAAEIIKNRGYDFINFNHYYDELNLNFETDYGDSNHVNMLGAEKYTAYLMHYISSKYSLPDHRRDEAYSRWNDDYAEFEESRQEWKTSINELVANHMAAHKKGLNLPAIEDFKEWADCIFDPNYSVIILEGDGINYPGDNRDFEDFLNRYDLNGHGMCMVWVGESCIVSANDSGLLETNIGVDGGRGTDTCIVSIGKNPYLKIQDKDYYMGNSKIQIVVYDNNYREIVDNVSIDWDTQNIIYITRTG